VRGRLSGGFAIFIQFSERTGIVYSFLWAFWRVLRHTEIIMGATLLKVEFYSIMKAFKRVPQKDLVSSS